MKSLTHFCKTNYFSNVIKPSWRGINLPFQLNATQSNFTLLWEKVVSSSCSRAINFLHEQELHREDLFINTKNTATKGIKACKNFIVNLEIG